MKNAILGSALVLGLAVSGSPSHADYMRFGWGVRTCAEWLMYPGNESTESWILGFWSGLNAEREAKIGGSSDPHLILYATRKECEAHPDEHIADAAETAYFNRLSSSRP
jgi:hypothetical protein